MKVSKMLIAGAALVSLSSCANMMDSMLGPSVPDQPLPTQPEQTLVAPTQPGSEMDQARNRLGLPPSGGTAVGGTTQPGVQPPSRPAVTPPTTTTRVPYATPVPGRPGFVYSPYSNAEIDVRGIKSGTLVRDPGDPNPDHKFYVP